MKDYEKIKEFVNEKDNAITVNDFKDAKIKDGIQFITLFVCPLINLYLN